MSIQQLNTRHSLKFIMAAKSFIAFVFEKQFSPGMVSNRNTVFSFLLDRIRAAPREENIFPAQRYISERHSHQRGIMLFDQMHLQGQTLQLKDTEKKEMTHTLDAKNSLGKITLSIWKFGVLLFKSNWTLYTCDSKPIFFLLR